MTNELEGSGSLVGRDQELKRLALAVASLDAGEGSAIRIEGAPGVGKTALLQSLDTGAHQVFRVTGIETESGFPFAGLGQLFSGLPGFRADGDDRDPATYLRNLAGLIAEFGPAVLIVDDAQWLDPSSLGAVGYLARRAPQLGVCVLVAWSLRGEIPEDWPGVERIPLPELERGDAMDLARASGLSASVAEAMVDAVGGNPLALVEAPAGLSVAQRAGRAVLPDPLPVGDRLQRSFATRIEPLPERTKEALLLAAAGAPSAMVAGELGPAEDAGLVRLATGTGHGVEFSHPMIRSAIYHHAEPSARRRAHQSIASSVDEPDRSWQLALAATGPDEALADNLEGLGNQALGRGAPATAAAALERAALLTSDRDLATARTLAAASAANIAGQPARTRGLLDALLPGIEDPAVRAEVQLLRGVAIMQAGNPREACAMLESEARSIEGSDPGRAAALLCQACVCLMEPGPLERVAEIAAQAVRLAPEGAGTIPAMITAEVMVARGNHEEARRLLDQVEPSLAGWNPVAPGHEILALDGLCRLWLGDHEQARARLVGLVDAGRAAGAESMMAAPLAILGTLYLRMGDLHRAAACADEASEIAATGLGIFGLTFVLTAEAMVAAHRGDSERCRQVAGKMLEVGNRLELTVLLASAEQALGLLSLGVADSDGAVEHLGRALGHAHDHGTIDPGFFFTQADLIEALVRSGRPGEALPVMEELERGADLTGSSWSKAAVERCRALLGPIDEIDGRLDAALEFHSDPPMPFESARTRLAIGEKLRRSRRRSDARTQLTAARDAFASMGATSWAERAGRELVASGGSGEVDADELTPRERDVCDLVAAGATNKEVASTLFLSTRTVEHHLRMAYRKLGVRSRSELAARRPTGENT